MRTTLTFILLFILTTFFGQNNSKSHPWDIGCDSMRTQTDMNICSYDSYKIADSILTNTYNKLILYLDSTILSEKKNTKDPNDKIAVEFLNLKIKQRQSVIETQKNFIKYRDSFTDIIGLQYQGGTMRPLVENIYALELTINQINSLTKVTQDITN